MQPTSKFLKETLSVTWTGLGFVLEVSPLLIMFLALNCHAKV